MDFTANYDMFLSDEHELLRKAVRDFAEKEVAPHIREWDRSGAQAEGPESRAHIRPLLQRLGQLGFLGICIPAKYGGAGMDYLALAVVCEELERCCSGAARPRSSGICCRRRRATSSPATA
jgi:alkylation response protein AidB-like acyl-CoA dehydrogenase